MRFLSFIIAFALFIGFSHPAHAGKLFVVTTTADLASLTREVGGDKVDVMAIAKGYQDPHFAEAKPSFLLKLRQADLLIAVGLELEVGWLPPLIQQSRNDKLLGKGGGYLDASTGCEILERQTGQVSRAMGDVHPFGNPHYWLEPNNGKIMATNIARKLSDLDQTDASYYQSRLTDFIRRLDAAAKRWDAQMAPYHGTKVVTYHNSWPNFARRFGLQVIGYVEPKPGVPPSPSHTLSLIQQIKSQEVKIILVEPYFDLQAPNAISRATGAKVVVLMPSVGGTKEVPDYFKLFDYDLNLLEKAFKEVGVTTAAKGGK